MDNKPTKEAKGITKLLNPNQGRKQRGKRKKNKWEKQITR